MWLRLSSRTLDWRLLLTVICIAHANPLVKLAGFMLLFCAPTTWRLRIGELGRFYIVMLILSTASSLYLLTHLDKNYILVLAIGLLFWLVCLLLHAMIYESVTRHPSVRTERTLRALFWVLFTASFLQYIEYVLLGPSSASIFGVLAVGGTGDHLKSVYTFSSDAMIVYGILMFYFLHKKWWMYALLAALALLWTNFMSGILILSIAWIMYIFLFRSTHIVVRLVVISLSTVVFFWFVFLNWKNFQYAYELLVQVAEGNLVARKLPAHLQTLSYITSGPKELLLGAGMGNFSSRLAFLTAGEYTDWYPSGLIYRHELFTQNHFPLWNHKILKQPIVGIDGTMNQPFSVYNQILGEYGLLGFALFLIFYVGFFMRKWKLFPPYCRALFFFMLGFLFLDYWFEFFSTLVVFEWIMLLAMKDQTKRLKPRLNVVTVPKAISIKKLFSQKISLPFFFNPKKI